MLRPLLATPFIAAICLTASAVGEVTALNQKADGYRGIWYQNQPLKSEYAFKYSGGLGTYCAKHKPFAIYSAAADKTFFCYGGTVAGLHQERDLKVGGIGAKRTSGALLHMVSYFDHKTGTVPRPTILLDKQTYDAHDNPVISLDEKGHIWIFSTAHGTMRPAFVHRSVKPHDIGEFERVQITREVGDKTEPVTNFSYFQAWRPTAGGFDFFFTRYKGGRGNLFARSDDGRRWTGWQKTAQFGEGHYQISAVGGGRAACAFNYHPKGKGLNWRTNLYYMETADRGESWQSASGKTLQTPLGDKDNGALVRDYESEGLLVYMKDILIRENGDVLILYITSKGYASGPKNGPRTWTVARGSGGEWSFAPITASDSNYDMGSLYFEGDRVVRLIAPTGKGPQAFNPGGEIEIWRSDDGGATWAKERAVTASSEFNHTYVRRPVNAHPDFYALWADGHGRQPSESRLYFCNKDGDAFRLPVEMDGEFAKPVPLRSKE